MPKPNVGNAKFTVNLPPDLIRRLKIRAIERGVHPGTIITESLSLALGWSEAKESSERHISGAPLAGEGFYG